MGLEHKAEGGRGGGGGGAGKVRWTGDTRRKSDREKKVVEKVAKGEIRYKEEVRRWN